MAKKLNKRGMTILEILISVTLLSVIMVSMYKLISDVRGNNRKLDTLASNSIKINEIESKIQSYLKDYYGSIESISIDPSKIDFKYNDAALVTVEISENDNKVEVVLKKGNVSKEKWTLEGYSLLDDKEISCKNGTIEDEEFEYQVTNIIINLKNNNGDGSSEIIQIPYYHQIEEGKYDPFDVGGKDCE